MPNQRATAPLLAAAAFLAVGCASEPPPMRSHTPEEIQALVERNNETADPYEMGTGDRVGTGIHRRYVDKTRDPD